MAMPIAKENAAGNMRMPAAEQTHVDDRALRLLAVVVLYKMKPIESVSFRTLDRAISHLGQEQAEIKIVLYDNTPQGQDVGALPAGVHYKADVENGGVAAAYNYALKVAQDEGFSWLLTLDQDTTLPGDFLCKLCSAARFVSGMPDVAAIAPRITSDGKPVSPFTIMTPWTVMRHFPEGFVGVSSEKTGAINSAFSVKVSALTDIGGYDPSFRLDFCDLVIGHRLNSKNLRVLVAGNIHVEHELSVFNLMGRVSLSRYENIQRAEEMYFDRYLGRIEGVMVLLRLSHRMMYKLWRAGAPLPYFKVGLRFLCRRLFYSRKHRLESRNQEVGVMPTV